MVYKVVSCFLLNKLNIKGGLTSIAEELIKEQLQNRIVIVFDDETIMLKSLPEIDGSINL